MVGFPVIPSIIVGWGDFGAKVVTKCEREVGFFHPDLVESYALFRFPCFLVGVLEAPQYLREILLGHLDDLRAAQLPEEEERYSIRGGAALVTRHIALHIIADLSEDEAANFSGDFLPFVLNLLAGLEPPNFYICLYLAVGDFDETDEVKERISDNLRQVNECIEENTSTFQPRIYVLDRVNQLGVGLDEKEKLAELCSTFIESVLLSDLQDPSIGRDVEFMLHSKGTPEVPYSTFGLATVDFPVVTAHEYCLNSALAEVLDVVSDGSGGEVRRSQGRAWGENLDLDPEPVPTSQLGGRRPRLPEREFSMFEDATVLKYNIKNDAQTWERNLQIWMQDRLDEVGRQAIQLKKKAIGALRERMDSLEKELLSGLRRLGKGCFADYVRYLEGISSKLNEMSPGTPQWTFLPRPSLAASGGPLNAIFDATDRRPLLSSVIIYFAALWGIGVYFLYSILLPRLGLLRAVLYPGLGLSLVCVIGYFAIFWYWHSEAKARYYRLLEEAGSYLRRLEVVFEQNLMACSLSYKHRMLSELAEMVRAGYNRAEICLRLLKYKNKEAHREKAEVEKIAKQLGEGIKVPIKSRVVQDTRFIRNTAKESDLQNLWKDIHSGMNLIERVSDDVEKTKVDVSDLILHGFIHEVFEALRKAVDRLLREFTMWEPRLGAREHREMARQQAMNASPFYDPARARLHSPTRQLPLVFADKACVENLNRLEFDSKPEIIIPTVWPNRFCFCRIEVGIPFSALRIS